MSEKKDLKKEELEKVNGGENDGGSHFVPIYDGQGEEKQKAVWIGGTEDPSEHSI